MVDILNGGNQLSLVRTPSCTSKRRLTSLNCYHYCCEANCCSTDNKMSRHREWDLSCKVYVGNLGNNGSKYELESIFSKYGPLRNVWVARNPPGFAFIEFEDPRDAEDAVRGLDGSRMCGTRARVEMSSGRTRRNPNGGGVSGGYTGGNNRRGGRERSRSRRRSISRSRSRSRDNRRSPADRWGSPRDYRSLEGSPCDYRSLSRY